MKITFSCYMYSHPRNYSYPIENKQYFFRFFICKSYYVNPILTGHFESKVLLGGGGQFDPPSDLGPFLGNYLQVVSDDNML